MRKKLPLLVLLLVCACGGLNAQNFSLINGREPVTSLDGLWRFHTGDNPAWASPKFDDSRWPLLRSDESWAKQGYPNYGGYAWYRFTVQVPDGSKPVSLLLPYIVSGYQVYANGKWIGSAGSATPTGDPVYASPEKVFQLPTGSGSPQTIQVALRVWAHSSIASWYGGGPMEPGSRVGDPVLLASRVQMHRQIAALEPVNPYAYCLLATVVGLSIFALFLLRRQDREYLWFSILLLASAAGSAVSVILEANGNPPFFVTEFLLHQTADVISVIAALAFFSIVLRVRRSYSWWIACGAAIASPLATGLAYWQWTGVIISYAFFVCCLLPAFFWIMIELSVGAARKDTSARLLLVPAGLLYGFSILNAIVSTTWQLGWQRKLNLLDTPFLEHPYPLEVENVVEYLFVLALLIFLVRRFSLARQEESRLSGEMEAARSMQSLLVPATVPSTPGFTVESVYVPASEVGGDFFQILPGEDGSLLVVVGDVSGKGLKAAMTVSAVVGALRNETSRQPSEVLADLNRVLHGQITGFATCCATLISSDGTMAVANAGHLSPYRNGEELAVEPGLPLGVTAEGDYAETEFQLAPGDRLTFVSDGVVEATNDKRELFGFERTQQISNQAASGIAQTAKQFGQEDDITVLSVQFAGAAQTVTT